MTISTKDFTTLVQNQVTAIQGAASALVDLTIGSILRAVVEANAAVMLWLQGLILQLLATTRAATSSGADLDSWVADYGLTRLAAVAATGQVSFARYTATLQALIQIGASVQTADGSQVYTVTLDTSNPAYSATLGGYVLEAGVTSVNVPVAASVAGAGANVSIGQINTITQALPGVDTVSNTSAFINGADAETDTALRARFVAFVAGLSKATVGAVGYAITSLQSGLSYSLTENLTYGGAAQMGYFFVVVDDGTGTPSSELLSSVSNAIDAVRPVTSTFGVFAPVVVTANVSMAVTTAAGYVHADVVATVAAAITNHINALALGADLPWSKLAQVAYDASAGVTNVTGLTLNGGTADLAATALQTIKAGTVAVS